MTTTPNAEATPVVDALEAAARAVEAAGAGAGRPAVEEVGVLEEVSEAVVRVSGLSTAKEEELLRLPGGSLGLAFQLEADRIGVLVLDRDFDAVAGARVHRTGTVATVPVGEALLGRVVDGIGRPLDGGGPLESERRLPVERDAPPILDRAPVSEPLQTGWKVVDALIPVGRGQRELVLGDRQTGKTALAVDAILNQRGDDVLSVYCAVGQRASAVARVIQTLREHDALSRTIVVVATGEDPPGLQYLAPFAATTMAEAFMEDGQDVLIVYDDVTRHARAYRELSLLLRRPPGREAYPGDIFYLHARLLERATHLKEERGGGSLTALPIVETQAGNLSSYIPTNLVSITDGQIYLSPDLFQKGLLPAVEVGRSVSRVGGKAQRPVYEAVSGPLRLAYSQFEELEDFARFGTRLEEDTRQKLVRGRRVRRILTQGEHEWRTPLEQVVVLLAAAEGVFDEVEPDAVPDAEAALLDRLDALPEDLRRPFEEDAPIEDDGRDALVAWARDVLEAREWEA